MVARTDTSWKGLEIPTFTSVDIMGAFKRHQGVTNTEVVVSTGPNPCNFKVKECHRVGDVWVSKINYPDAKNFEGDKILLTAWNPLDKTVIDPHFATGSGILARFEPSKFGWNLAIKTAKMIVDK